MISLALKHHSHPTAAVRGGPGDHEAQSIRRRKAVLHAMDKLDHGLVKLFQQRRASGDGTHDDKIKQLIDKLELMFQQVMAIESNQRETFRLSDLHCFPLIIDEILEQPLRKSPLPSPLGRNSSDMLLWLYAAIEVESDRWRTHLLNKRINLEIANRHHERNASAVNGTMYPVWVNPLPKSFTGPLFLDPDEEPRLSPEQQKIFSAWKRPFELFRRPVLISNAAGSVCRSDLSQSPVVANCSFISSLLIMARHEATKPGFATAMLFPKNSKGVSVMSPSGKYQVRLFWNGAHRSVVVDDLLPVDTKNSLLCARSRSDELWATIMEKAYLKLVAGGYDLWTGSHSGIDLYALTGWPPETFLLGDPSVSMDNDILWKRLKYGMVSTDHNLVTASTRMDINEESTGLSRGHSFAVLEVREENNAVRPKRKLLLRNPWGGAGGATADGAMFWVELDQMAQLFQAVHVNWNLAMFAHVSHHPCTIPAQEDIERFGFSHSTQFAIEPQYSGDQPQEKLKWVWVLLSRHVTSVTQLQSAENAVAVHAFDASSRVWLPSEARLLHRGKHFSGPHSMLCRIETPPTSGQIVVVLSAYAPKAPVHCTLSIFSTLKYVKVQELPVDLDGGFARMIHSLPFQVGPLDHLWMVRFPKVTLGIQPSGFRLRAAVGTSRDYDWELTLSLWLLDVKNATKMLLARSPSRKTFTLVETRMATELVVNRTSIRFVLEPEMVRPVAEGKTPVGVQAIDNDEDDDEDYFLEVHCDLLDVVLVAPTDVDQQVLLKKMMTDFRTVPLDSRS